MNSCRNRAAVVAPAFPPVLLISAAEQSSSLRYGAQSGKFQTGSCTVWPCDCFWIACAVSCVLLNRAGSSRPNATRAAPVKVAKSMRSSGFSSQA